MEPQKTIYSNVESSFSLYDIFWYVMRKWRKLLIIMGACALLLGIYRGVALALQRSGGNKQSSSQSEQQSTPDGDPAILMQPSDITVSAGGNASFSIATSGPVEKYQWQYSKDGMSWTSLNTGTYPSAATDHLTFKSMSAQNGYVFRCSVTFVNDRTITSHGAVLTVGGSGGGKLSVKAIIVGALKYALIGLAAGLFLGAAFYAVRFVSNGYVAGDYALKSRYGVPVFGVYPTEEAGSGKKKTIWERFDRFILNKVSRRPNLSPAKSARLIAANMALHTEDQKILLMGTVSDEMLEYVRKLLRPYLNGEIRIGGNVNRSAEAIVALVGAQTAVCVEQIHYSMQREVDTQMEAIDDSPAKCIGFILVE